MKLLERIPAGARIAVIRLRSLGDCVLTTPALALLHRHRPDLELGVVVEDRFAAVFEGNPGVAHVLPPQKSVLFRFRPAAVLNLHGGTRSMGLTIASAARIRTGFAHHPYSFLYTDKIPRAQEILGEERPVHTAEHLASAMFWMGVPRTEIPRAQLFAEKRATGGHAVLHPFASRADKAWPVDRFLEAARFLERQCGLEAVIVAGPADDVAHFRSFRVLENRSLSEVKSWIAGASLFLGNDSGPAHIAAAFGVPAVVLFGPSNPVTWRPWRTEAQVLTSRGPIDSITSSEVIVALEAVRVKA